MNLGRAKLVLIIAFTGLNLFLGYQLFWPDFGRLTTVAVTAEDMQAAENKLKENNFSLETSIDRAVHTSDFLTVSPDRVVRSELLKHFIDKGARIEGSENTTVYRLEEKKAVVHANGLLQVFYDPGIYLAESYADLEERELKDLIYQFIEDKSLIPEGIQFDYLEKNGGGKMTVHYHQVLDGVPVYSSQLKVIVDSDHIVALEIYWLKPVERVPIREMQVISAVEALTNLVNELGPSTEPRQIEQVKLGYFSGEYDAEKWEIPPVWRIVIDGREHFFINAFTGNMEQESVIPKQVPN